LVMGNAESRQLADALSSACQGTDGNIPSGQLQDPQFHATFEGFLRHVELVWDKLPACMTDAIKSKFSPRFESSTDPEAWVQQQIFGETADDMATYLYDQLTALSSPITPLDIAKKNLLLVAFARLRKLHESRDGRSALADCLQKKGKEKKVRDNCSNFALAGERLESVLSEAGGCGALICGLAISWSTLTTPRRFKKTNIETIRESVRQENIGRCNKQVDVLLTLYESQTRSWIDRQQPPGRKRKRGTSYALLQSPPRIVDTQHAALDCIEDAHSTEPPLVIARDELLHADSPSNLPVQRHYAVVSRGSWASHAEASHPPAMQATGGSYTPSTTTTEPITPPARGTREEGLANNDNQEPSSGQVSNAVPSTMSDSWYRDVSGNIQQRPVTSPNVSFRSTFGTAQQFLGGIVNGTELLTLHASSFRLQRPLAVQYTVPDTAQSITFAIEGNIAGLEYLFNQGLASPRDVSISRGYSLIRWALYGGMHQYETVQYLMSRGAPVDEESYEHVWDFSFRQRCTNDELIALSCIREKLDRDWIDDQKFPVIHQIIFGLASKSLAAELKENPDAVRLTDAQGRTALDWATARAQLDNMRLLIKHGSDVNTMDLSGRTTVLHAVDSHSEAALQIVLKAGANPNPDIPDALCRSSPLTSASFGGLKEMTRLLLDFGANVDTRNPEGRTALHTTIIHNNHEMLRLFVNKCDKYSHLRGLQLLPTIARYADEQTISILVSSLPFLKTLDLNCDGSIREILRQRRNYCEKLKLAFEGLLTAASV
ncbi:ankyrin repeat containing protein, partial [Colletotrichum incanum]